VTASHNLTNQLSVQVEEGEGGEGTECMSCSWRWAFEFDRSRDLRQLVRRRAGEGGMPLRSPLLRDVISMSAIVGRRSGCGGG